MRSAKTFAEWRRNAIKVDQLEGMDMWRGSVESKDYDYKLIRDRLNTLIGLKNDGSIRSVNQAMFLLRAGMIRNLGGICNHRLYRFSRVGTMQIIEDYIQVSEWHLTKIAECDHPDIGLMARVDFFSDMIRAYGRTALVLHGGASFGLCHLGVAKSLYEEGLLPKIVVGSYIGAVMAAAICVQDERGLEALFSEDETSGKLDLTAFRKPGGIIGSVVRKLLRFARHGCLLDVKVVEESARRTIGDITFKEAYFRSGRILNIIVHSKQKLDVPVLLNYLTAPDVVVWSAASASCAVPGLYETVTLYAKCPDTGLIRPWHPTAIRMESAFLQTDIPVSRLAELFNVNNFIVSQVPSYFSIQISPSEEATSFGSKMIKLFGDELGHRYTQFKQLGLVPTRLQYFERFFHAPLPGDITISPSISFGDFFHVVQNPTPAFVQYCIQKGEQSVWKRMMQVRIRSELEYSLERKLDLLKQKQSAGKSVMRSSVDSVFGNVSPGVNTNSNVQLKHRTRSFEL